MFACTLPRGAVTYVHTYVTLLPCCHKAVSKGECSLENRNKTHKCEFPTFSLSAAFLGLSLLFDEQSEQVHQSNKDFCNHFLYLFKVLNGRGRKYRHPTRTVTPGGKVIPAEILDLL